jgi:hypothetical protein
LGLIGLTLSRSRALFDRRDTSAPLVLFLLSSDVLIAPGRGTGTAAVLGGLPILFAATLGGTIRGPSSDEGLCRRGRGLRNVVSSLALTSGFRLKADLMWDSALLDRHSLHGSLEGDLAGRMPQKVQRARSRLGKE